MLAPTLGNATTSASSGWSGTFATDTAALGFHCRQGFCPGTGLPKEVLNLCSTDRLSWRRQVRATDIPTTKRKNDLSRAHFCGW